MALGELLLALVASVGIFFLPFEHQAPWWSPMGIVSDLAWGLVATLPLMALAAAILAIRWEPLIRLTTFVLDHIAPLLSGASWPQLICLAAAAGFCEELLFRGLIQQLPSVWIPGTVGLAVGVAASAVLFGLAHAMTVSYLVLATLISMYFSTISILSGSLVAAMVAHGTYDLIAIVMILREYRKRRHTR